MSIVAALALLLVAVGPLLASWLLVRTRRRATRRTWSSLPELVSTAPLTAYKTAQVLLAPDGRHALFTGVTLGRSYTARGRAGCPRPGCEPPGLDCECGFYAFRRRDDALGLFGRRLPFNGLTSKALLAVELSGRILEYERGYRAQHQTVLGVGFSPRCAVCADRRRTVAAVTLAAGQRPVSALGSLGWALTDSSPPDYRPVYPVCVEHAEHHATVRPADLAGLLGTEVTWLAPGDDPRPPDDPAGRHPTRWGIL